MSISTDLGQRWQQLKQTEPMLRARDAAAKLGVSEGELVASRCGDGVIRLDGPWQDVLKGLEAVGPVMALTRNAHCVHEKHGRYRNFELGAVMGVVLDEDIDLRLFFRHWSFAFAVEEQVRSGLRRSLQVFDVDGTAVHKVYLEDDSDAAAFDALVARHRAADQSARQAVGAVEEPLPFAHPDGKIDAIALRAAWRAMRDPHDFFALLRKHEVSRTQALRLAGSEFAWTVAVDTPKRVLHAVRDAGIPIMVFVGSPGVVQIHTGPVSNLKQTGPWFNVLDPSFNLHLREDAIVSCWVVTKPSPEGPVTSLEAYDADGRQIVQLFGKRKPGIPERVDWRELLHSLPQRLDGSRRDA